MAMTGFSFNKQSCERYIDALQIRRPIDAPAEGWTVDEMIALAGACASIAGAFCRGVNVESYGEHLEADEERSRADSLAAIEFAESLASAILDQNYDQQFEQHLEFGVSVMDGKTNILHVKGFKVDH